MLPLPWQCTSPCNLILLHNEHFVCYVNTNRRNWLRMDEIHTSACSPRGAHVCSLHCTQCALMKSASSIGPKFMTVFIISLVPLSMNTHKHITSMFRSKQKSSILRIYHQSKCIVNSPIFKKFSSILPNPSKTRPHVQLWMFAVIVCISHSPARIRFNGVLHTFLHWFLIFHDAFGLLHAA